MARLIRERLGTFDTVVAGLGAMIGAGVFAGLAPAAGLAGRWLLLGLVIAAVPAMCSAMATADQSAAYPGSGAGYRYTSEQLGPWPARLTTGPYLLGRIAGAAALAGCCGAYLLPARPIFAAFAVLAVAVVADITGVRIPAILARGVVLFVMVALALFVLVCFTIAPPPPTGINPPSGDHPWQLLPVAGMLFFAFLGFERVTAAHADQSAPSRHSLRVAIPVLLGVALLSYLAVGAATLRQLGAIRLALSPAPLRDALVAADGAALSPVLTVAAVLATVGALITLVSGAGRTVRVMAEVGDLPRIVAGRHAATVLIGVGGAAGVLLLTSATAIGLAATCMLLCFAFSNAAARLLCREERVWPASAACVGLGSCVLLALAMPATDLLGALLALMAGVVVGGLGALGQRRVRR